ncbi:discoidin domain-containing protein [Phycisphaeraceae bacterium D3-23]
MTRFPARYGTAPVALAAALLSSGGALAEGLPLQNPGLDTRGARAHSQPLTGSQLPQWRVTTEDADNIIAWFGVGDAGGWGIGLTDGGVIEQTLTVPALPEGRDPANWYGLVALDTRGAGEGRGRAGVSIELIDPATGNPIGRAGGLTTQQAPADPRAGWTSSADSFNPGPNEATETARAIDGDPASYWHTQWEGAQPAHPHHYTLDLGERKHITAVTYLPRQDRATTGTIAEYVVHTSEDGERWVNVAAGTFEYAGDFKQEQTIPLRFATGARYVRLEAKSEINGEPYTSAAEVGVQTTDAEQTRDTPVEREWLYLSPARLADLAGKELVVRVSGLTDRPAVVDAVRMYRFHTTPTRRLQNKPNGQSGPDYLDAGAYGFGALIEHQHAAMTVIHVRDTGPAHDGGLRQGDCIVAINRVPLSINNANPGWQWFHEGHEATLGRAVEASFDEEVVRARRGVVELQVLRAGRPMNLRLRLTQDSAFAESFPFDDPKADAMADDLIAFIARTQRDDGSWARDQIRTTFSALALLGSRDPQYAEQIKRAMDWTLEQHSDPWAYGNLGYWKSSYGAIFAAEYYLATGDERVLPWLQRVIDWSAAGDHNSAWDRPTLGHGPGGLPYGNKSLVAPTVHLMVAESLALRCGLEANLTPVVMRTVEHAWSDPADGGHGALGYNASYKDLGEFWSRTGMLALALALRDERPDMVGPLTGIMRERFPWIRNSHAYGEPGGALGLIALSVADPDAFAHVMRELRWTFAGAWEPGHGLRFTMPHMGAPYMGEEDLVNGAYGALLSVRHHGLHITGATDTGWLSVAGIPTKLTPVTIERDAAGQVVLFTKLPGPTIRYTLDGSEPTADSLPYTEPFVLADGGLVKARAFDEVGTPGDTVSAAFGLDRSGWQVIAATGAPEPERAIEKAQRAIDGRVSVVWQTNAGKDPNAFPHHVVIDLGERVPVSAVSLVLRGEDMAPADLKISVSDTSRRFDEPAGEATFDGFERERTVQLDQPAWGRYVRLDMTTALAARPMLLIAELDILAVTPTIERQDDGTCALAAPTGFAIRYTTDGTIPTATSPVYDAPVTLEAGQPLKARCFADGYEGPVAVLDRE